MSAPANRPTAEDIANAERTTDETIVERRYQALSLRVAGMTYRQIAAVLGVSADTARTDVEWAKRDVMTHSLEDVIATQRAIILDLRRACYPVAMNPKEPEDQARAIGKIFEGMHHEAKLTGAYAPMRTVGAPTDTEFGEKFLQLIRLVQPDTLKELTRGYLSANPAVAGDYQGDASERDAHQPVDAEVVELNPERAVDAAGMADPVVDDAGPAIPLGHCRVCGQKNCDGQHIIAEDQDDDDDDWANT